MKVENNNLPEIEKQKFNFDNGIKFISKLLANNWHQLLLLAIGVYIPLQIFGIMATKLWQYEAGFPFDVPILLAVHETVNSQLDVFAVTLAKIGSPKTLIPVLLVINLVLVFSKRWRLSAYLLAAGFGSATINHAAKVFFHRVRPHLWEPIVHEGSFAFPSGHAMASFTFAAILIVLAWHTRWRVLAFIFGAAFVPGVAWTRLYLAVHFPSDIIAGWLIALAWVVGVYAIIRPYKNQTNLTEEEVKVSEANA
ncbi:phosphoesterase, PA-phosphatase related [Rivularia sp. IAM M-261]|nr:phosphoesterase, PA-phosphatase related [Calothrix sp. PCC 7716]GJD19786.1 phosphoesterase, PA-phosphatase related [Rivularia sp. IAM M-261]